MNTWVFLSSHLILKLIIFAADQDGSQQVIRISSMMDMFSSDSFTERSALTDPRKLISPTEFWELGRNTHMLTSDAWSSIIYQQK